MVFNEAVSSMRILPLLSFVWILISSSAFAAAGHEPAYPHLANGDVQHASFPKPLETYPSGNVGVMETIKERAAATLYSMQRSTVCTLSHCSW